MNVPCVPLLHTVVRDLFHAGQPALIGLQATHGSHTLAYKRGIWWCVACGSWASSAARNLSRPCTGQPTKDAQDVLARLDKGSRRNLTSSGSLRTIEGASMRFGVWDPHENPGRWPKNRAGVVAVLL